MLRLAAAPVWEHVEIGNAPGGHEDGHSGGMRSIRQHHRIYVRNMERHRHIPRPTRVLGNEMAPRHPAQNVMHKHTVENASPTTLAPGDPATHLLHTPILIKSLRKTLQRIRGPTFGASTREHRKRHRSCTCVDSGV